MAFERFTRDARTAVVAAHEEAVIDGRAVVEAEHLLLALAPHPGVEDLGLDRADLIAALTLEEERSLAAVGVAAADFAAPAIGRRSGRPRLATSTKVALERALAAAAQRGDRRITVRHLLAGVVAAEHGRVPRALRLAEINVPELRARLLRP
jgi:ATP-dependent Clp protease ATP-binding subunit ClpA